jgi:asparagine synthase (glutamine-hydrolysing)
MCGIAGIFYYNKAEQQNLRAEIAKMTACLVHRGPDDSGYYIGGHVALGHRRLSIIDLKTGHQPMFNEDKSICIIFNGEIYNFQEIKSGLIQNGHQFSSNSDTETIIHAYEEWGEACVEKLRGMFAFCIWDAQDKKLFLARDRLGEKPVFYTSYNGKFAFASEMKSILVDPQFDRSVDGEALASYFTFSYIPAPQTIFKNIRKLPAGYFLTIRDGHIKIKRYWDVAFEPDMQKKEDDFILEFMELLEESVKIRLMSDVPLGAFLSGGIDSSTVVAMMSHECSQPVKTFTIGFGGNTGGFEDERPYARLVAEKYRTNHREYEVLPAIEELLDKIVTSFDEPFADDSTIPSYYVCKMARENVTVALSGLGGDETFAGYERYLGFRISQFYNKIPEIIRKIIFKKVIERFPESSSGAYRINHIKRFARSSSTDYARQYLGFVSRLNGRYRYSFFSDKRKYADDTFNLVEESFFQIFNSGNAKEPLNKVFYTDIKTYLPEDILACTDRMSMHNSLEVRTPFIDHKLVEFCATIPPEMKMKWFRKKCLLKKGVSHLLPGPVLTHRKQGFVGPMTKWLQTDLKALTLKKLSQDNLKKHGIFNPQTIKNILDDHYSGKEINDTLIWSLLIFQKWFDLYMK